MTSLKFIILIFILTLAVADPNMGRPCKAGEKGEKPGIQYYVDGARNQIYPFYYHGCGAAEERNRFPTPNAARALQMIDYNACGGYAKSTGVCGNGLTITMIIGDNQKDQSTASPKPECPEGSHCDNRHPVGQCCPLDVAARFAKNRQAACKGEKKAVKENGGVVFGRSCSHNFCPVGSECVDGEFVAYCCKK